VARRTGKAISLTVNVNPASGKKATRSLAFSDEGWGRVTRSYLTSIKNLTHDQLTVIFDDAKQFAKAVRPGGSKSSQAEMDPEDERAFLAEGDGSNHEQSPEV
jgi:hypothetical protein